jgi:glycosyltransferase involved in cell wall biosynthesis
MKIAILSTVPMVPPTAGNRSRILAFVRALRRLGHETHFVHLPSVLTDIPDDQAHIEELGPDRYFRLPAQQLNNVIFRAKRLIYRLRRKLFRAAGTEMAYYHGLDEHYPSGLSDLLKQVHAKHKYDAVVCEYIFHSAALDAFPSEVIKILDTHDSFADRHRLFPEFRNYWFSVTPENELTAFRRADVVIAIQELERQAFSARLGADGSRVALVSHILDLEDPVAEFSSSKALFIGSLNEANLAALQYFTESVLPLIQREIPDFSLLVAGSISRHIEKIPGVELLGIVDNLRDAFVAAPINVNPMLTGTGINIKLLEAMAAGVPTVSTETGSRGLGDAFSNGVVTVDDRDAPAFAAAVVHLARSEERRRAQGALAYRDAVAWNDAQIASLRQILARSPEDNVRRSADLIGS